MRVSDRYRYDLSASRLAKSKSHNAEVMEKLSTQKDINHISDNPVGYSQVVRLNQDLDKMTDYGRNIDYAKGYLETAEVAVGGILDNLIRAKELGVAMANATYDDVSRQATAMEVRQIMDAVVNLGNTEFNGRYVFGGFRTKTPPMSDDGQFLGDDGAIFLKIGPDRHQQININTREFFEASDEDIAKGVGSLYNTLNTLHIGLENNSTDEVHRAMYQLDHQLEKASIYQSKLGAIYASLDQARQRIEQTTDLAKGIKSKTEDADIYKITSDFKRTESALQSTLMASNKLLQPSLLNFMQ